MKVFSGIQPTGEAHIGNYSGGFRQYAATQEQGEAYFCIVDLHAITVPHDPAELRDGTLDIGAMLFATGLDAERSTVFVQSQVQAHAEAAWLLGSVTSYGELRRMTQFKEKSAQQDFVSSALFSYPTLMAGDILLYQTDVVPIGDDQRQHLELTRDIAERFNTRFGETFTVPDGVYPEVGARVMDLQDPTKKMSKSFGNEQGKILLLDDADTVRRKIKRAVADSGREIRHDLESKPGISNLIELVTVATGETIQEVEARFDGQGYGEFKESAGDALVELLEPIQARYRALRSDPAELDRLLSVGADKAREASAPTLGAMYDRMGFVR
jgi:tryptophanyl-tRNA synthetase